ncbi:DUF2970 domain-containing protein [Arhodomonas sp. AD133]|uniref:DUF2970 domain-containing protein n=1 Tax=Arhodomonas sp. AD133 TaxID=3415009 RepID=UPI003EB86051
MKDEGSESRPTRWQVIKSVVAAALGVQSEEARQRDFTQGSPAAFIIGGVVFTALFVIALVVVVNLVLSAAGSG